MREALPVVAAGGGSGGDSQSRQREGTPDAKPAGKAAEFDPPTTARASQDTPRDSEAINASGAKAVSAALVALGVPRADAESLARLPHVDLSVVAFASESLASAKTKPARPGLWVASLVRKGPSHLEGWDAFQRRTQQRLIRAARDWALLHTQDAVYGAFVNAVFAAIRPHFPRWDDAIRDGNLHPSVIRPDARPVEVLASLAASCDVDLEIPTDTLRMPEARGEVTTQRSQVQ